MSRRFHIFVTQRARDDAVDRIMAAFLDAYQARPLDEPNGGRSLSQPGGGDLAQPSESNKLLLFERLLLVLVAVVTALVVAGNL